jgi:hypothetical protein
LTPKAGARRLLQEAFQLLPVNETERKVNATNVGLRLLAMWFFQSIQTNHPDRYREQAKAYREMHCKCQIEMQSKWGSEPARED